MNNQHCPEIAGKTCQHPLRWNSTHSDPVYKNDTPISDTVSSSRSNFSQTGRTPALPIPARIPTLGHDALPALAEVHTFLPGLVTHFLAQQEFPTKRELAVLFVDIADSTSAVVRQPPEKALAVVQRFMNLVTEVALAHHGDVKDYEGDGALLYFASVEQAARAALDIQQALAAKNERKEVTLQARLSLNVGEVIIGVVGSPQRRSVALIGPAVHLASRLLKHIPPGGIIAPQSTLERLDQQAPDIASQFQLFGQCLVLKGFEEECVTAYHIPSPIYARGIEQRVLS